MSGIYDEDDGDLPNVDFITETNDRKGIVQSDVSFDKKARIDFDSLIKDITSFYASSESHTAKKVVPLQLDDLDEFNCNDSDEEPQSVVESIVRVSPIKINKREIDIEDLKKYLHTNIHTILNKPYSKDLFMSSKDAPNYLEVYETEAEIIKIILRKLEPNLNILNNLYIDRILLLSVETIKQYLRFKFDHIDFERPETSPCRADIRAKVHANIKVNAERMNDRYSKKKRLFVQFLTSYHRQIC